MRYSFTKMQSLGNDFVMLNGIAENIRITPEIARYIGDRHFGIGCDQILLAEEIEGSSDIRLRIFNCDGSEVGQCGNGARCFAGFLRDQKLVSDGKVSVTTCTTRLDLNLNQDGTVTVGMGMPEFEPARIPLDMPAAELTYRLDIDKGQIEFSAMSLGNPHCVLDVPDVKTAAVGTLGPILEKHPVFPQKANIGFAHYDSKDSINLRVFERGVGETLGCGSGACAAAVSGMRRQLLERKVDVTLPGGTIQVNWPTDDSQVYLTGAIHRVYEGKIDVGNR